MLIVNFPKNLLVKNTVENFHQYAICIVSYTLYDWIEIAFLGFCGFFQEDREKHGKKHTWLQWRSILLVLSHE